MALRKALTLRRPRSGRLEGRTAPTPGGSLGYATEDHLVGSVDADGCAEGLADRTVQHEVGYCV